MRVGLALWLAIVFAPTAEAEDVLRTLQEAAVRDGASPAAHWGPDATRYSSWTTHTNRLIPVYTYGTLGAGEGVDLTDYTGENSVYRDPRRLMHLYGRDATDSVCDTAEYMDQTNIYNIQLAGLQAGKKYIFLVIFDGFDWQTARAAAIYRSGHVGYDSGRGTGLHLQDYTASGTAQFSWMVTSPFRDGTQVDVNLQKVFNPLGGLAGGYDPRLGGATPWETPSEPYYLTAAPSHGAVRHAYTDSASSASSMTSGIKTYNNSVNVDPLGRQHVTLAHRAQQAGYRVGVVTSVPISHATPAAAYAHNVHRDDYQDLTRDLLGLESVSHPRQALPGMDVVIGCGYGVVAKSDKPQGDNFVPGNVYVTDADLERSDVVNGGRYVVSVRTANEPGGARLRQAAERAAREGRRLFGYFGIAGNQDHVGGTLPYATANGDFRPVAGKDGKPIDYTPADLAENPTLAEMTAAALVVLEQSKTGFWLMVEAGEVDWANHENNLDSSIGAVLSGDAAVKVITDWVEQHSNWQESLMILTGDHGHYLVIDWPELLIGRPR